MTHKPLLVPVSTRLTQGQRANDFCFVPEGELLQPGHPCDKDRDNPDGPCGCSRSLAAARPPSRGTTTALLVAWEAGGVEGLAQAYRDALVANDWYKPDEPRGLERGREMAEEMLTQTAGFAVGDVVEYRSGQFARRERP